MTTTFRPLTTTGWLTAALLLVSGCERQPSVPEPPLDPVETAEAVTLAPQGPRWASGPEVERLLDRIREQPEHYVAALKGYVEMERWVLSSDPLDRSRAQNAAIVLVEYGGDPGRAAANEALAEAIARQSSLADTRNGLLRSLDAAGSRDDLVARMRGLDRQTAALTEFRNCIVSSLRSVGDPRAATPLLDHLDRNVDGLQAIAVPYLRETAGREPAVREALQRLANDPRSTFYERPQAKRD